MRLVERSLRRASPDVRRGPGLLFEYLDDTIKTKEDLGQVTRDAVPAIGLIPAVGSWKDRGAPMVVSLTDPKSPVAEAYRSLRTSIQFLGLDRPLRTLQVTSPAASEGQEHHRSWPGPSSCWRMWTHPSSAPCSMA